MKTELTFNGGNQKVILTPNDDVSAHADIDIIVENYEAGKDEPECCYLFLKEHEAEYLAEALKRYVDTIRRDNERWLEDQKNNKNEN